MLRPLLPALVVSLLPFASLADELRVPGLSPKKPTTKTQTACVNKPYDKSNCVQVFACLGDGGDYLIGRAYGWDFGTVIGVTSTQVSCTGTWKSGGFMGSGSSTMECSDGVSARILYLSQDNKTGTVFGTGYDSRNRWIRVWTGLNVLQYLKQEHDGITAVLPCGSHEIPIS